MPKTIHNWFDRVAIHYATTHMPQPNGRDPQVKAAEAFLHHADFFPKHNESPSLNFGLDGSFTFPSILPSNHSVNNTVKGRFYRCGDDWRKRPTVLLLHGWNDFLNHHWFFPRHAQALNRLELNAMTLQLPFHFERKPRHLGLWANFLSADLLQTMQLTKQALADIRSAINWLFAAGSPQVGVWGVSLGGWLSALTICQDDRIGAAVLQVPVARLNQIIEEVPFCETIRAVMGSSLIPLTRLNPLENLPVIDNDKILIIEAMHDLFMARHCTEEMWERWGRPEIWRIPCGHVSVLWRVGLAPKICKWISGRLLLPAAK